ncbi:hypothetical protein [Spirosoma luteum]|uniref:hypothetical protein n=1 Tax=Spirosoma luteum TaxID=431553 RepID=UPI00037E41D8|nr:hypothetical protein [Spirosoma luteum]
MKKAILLMLAGFLAMQAYAAPITTKGPKMPKATLTLEQQLAKYISYPDALNASQQAGIVVIQFRVNGASELCQLEVFSQNDKLNHTLLRQLTGKKLPGYGSIGLELYTVRLHFQPD